MDDLLPANAGSWHFLEDTVKQLLTSYGYGELRTPIMEFTELFCRSVGEVTDIVEKEMYAFDDHGHQVALRPEGTASAMRACIQHGLVPAQTHKLWYMGPMFRRENTQRGRRRQFHQVGMEVIGLDGPDIDVELIAMLARLWQQLGLTNLTLELNSLGTLEARNAYKAILTEFYQDNSELLDAESQRRLGSNPLRILDSKNPQIIELNQSAPSLADHLDAESAEHFAQLCESLDTLGIAYTVNPKLVRGLDYYSRTVFEWISNELGAQGTVCAGGRYDGLVEQLGGRATPAVGAAMGMERLIELIKLNGEHAPKAPHAYLVTTTNAGVRIAESLRNQLPTLRLITNMGAGSFKAQLRRADKSGARIALIVGETELNNDTITVKPLRGEGEQETLSIDQTVSRLAPLID